MNPEIEKDERFAELERKHGAEAAEILLLVEKVSQEHDREIVGLKARLDDRETWNARGDLDKDTRERLSSPLLTAEQKAAPFFGNAEGADYPADEVRLGAMLLARLPGGEAVRERLNDAERKALLTTPNADGGYMVPTLVSAPFLDAIRNKAQVIAAGAVTVPLRAKSISLPGWDVPPSAGWRGEGGAFHDGGGSFRAVELVAKMVSSEVDISIEFIQDSAPNLDEASVIVERAIATALALAVDLAALEGAGGTEPTGLANIAGIAKTSLAATPVDYSFLGAAIGACRGRNFEPSSAIFSARTATTLDGLTDSTGQPLNPPESVRGIKRLVSNQVADDGGAGANESSAYVGDFSRLAIGARPDLGVRSQTDPFSKGSTGLVTIRSYIRADVAVLDEGAFQIVDGILP